MATSENTRLAALVAAGTAGVALLAALAFVGLQIWAPADRFAACRAVQVAGGQKFGGPFTLTAQNGERVSSDTLFARPALVYFGYTFCPDVCPLDVVRNVEAVDLLTDAGHDIRPVFITVDPARDTVQALSDYAEAMHPDMVALTGGEAELRAALSAYGGIASKQDDDPEYYLMSHTTLTYLALPGDEVVAVFTRRMGPEDLAEKTACYLDAAS